MNRVVVSGIGTISPLGIGKKEYWNSLEKGKSGGKSLNNIHSSDLFKNKKFASRAIAESKFNFNDFSSPKDIKYLDRYIQFAVAGASMAMQDSGLTNIPKNHFGVSLSTAIGGTKMMEEVFVKATNNGTEDIDPGKAIP